LVVTKQNKIKYIKDSRQIFSLNRPSYDVYTYRENCSGGMLRLIFGSFFTKNTRFTFVPVKRKIKGMFGS
jgi:hypothetical protein